MQAQEIKTLPASYSSQAPLALDWFQNQHQEILGTIQQKEKELRAYKKQAQLLQRLDIYLRKNWVCHLWQGLEDKHLVGYFSSDPEQEQRLSELKSWAHKAIKEQSRQFPTLLQQACQSHQVALAAHSRHPHYSFKDGFFTLEIHSQDRWAELSTPVSRLAKIAADPEALIERLCAEEKRVCQPSPTHFRNKLLELAQGLASEHSPIPLKVLLKAWLAQDKQAKAEVFLWGLMQEIEGGRQDFRLLQTKDTQAGILFPFKSRPGYFGWLVLESSVWN